MKALRSLDVIETTDAIWRLVQVREPTAIRAIQKLASESPHALVRNNAQIAALVLSGDEDRLLKALEHHDHRRMPMWIKGLLHLGSARTLAALKDYAEHGPDETCRQRAASALSKAELVKPLGLH